MSCSDEAGLVIEQHLKEGSYRAYKDLRDLVEKLEACKKLNAEEKAYLRWTKTNCEQLDKKIPEYLERWEKEKGLDVRTT